MSQRFEAPVLSGTAILLLNLPLALRGSPQPLEKLFYAHYPNMGSFKVVLHREPVPSTSGDAVNECGAVLFGAKQFVWEVLDSVRIVLRTEDGPLELRRGWLNLGVHEILVEGVVTWGQDGRPRTAHALPATAGAPVGDAERSTAAPTTARDARHEPATPSPTSRGGGAPSPYPSAAPPVRRPEPEPRPTPLAKESGVEEGETVVVAMQFKEIYNRNRDTKADQERTRRGGVPGNFALTPFMAYQVLAAVCKPRKIVTIESRRDAAVRVTRMLVELESAEAAEEVIRFFTRRAVEFVSESAAYKYKDRFRKQPQSDNGKLPICAEVRYYVNCSYSLRNGQPRVINGQRNYHRTITVRRNSERELDCTDAVTWARLKVVAPWEWQPDPHAVRPASVRGRDSPNREEVFMEEDLHTTADLRPTALPHLGQLKRPRSPSPRRGRRSRTPSSRSASPSSRSSSYYSTSSSRSSRRHRHRREPRGSRRDSRDRHARPLSGGTSSAAVAHEAVATAHMQHQPQPSHVEPYAAQPTYSAAAALAPAPPAVAYDSLGALPPGWRPIFSQEYQQTYYAFRNPVSGAETTTWERPTA